MGWTAWEKVTGEGMDFIDILYDKKYHTELEGGIARIMFNRPEKYNAFRSLTFDEMCRSFYDASHDPMIGVVMLSGVGDHFGTGGDVEWEKHALKEAHYWKISPNRVLRICRKPVIAMVKGYCIGGHDHLAYCCDFTIAADNAIFGQNAPRVSSPIDGYIPLYLTRVVGAKKAREIWMLCRRYTVSEALEMGLINKVVPLERLEEEVDKWCEQILTMSSTCIEVLKASFDWEVDSMPQVGLILNWLNPDFFDSREADEGPLAFMEKRMPNYWKIKRAEIEARQKIHQQSSDGFKEGSSSHDPS